MVESWLAKHSIDPGQRRSFCALQWRKNVLMTLTRFVQFVKVPRVAWVACQTRYGAEDMVQWAKHNP